MTGHYIIKEYDCFTRGETSPGEHFFPLAEKTFDRLEQFILANHGSAETEGLELMSISSRRGIGKIIAAKNYVGIIVMQDGTEIEILPKIYSPGIMDEAEVKRIFIEMLKTMKEVPYKIFNAANLQVEKMNIYEIFIRMFIGEVFLLVKRGLKSSYNSNMDNLPYWRGKLLFGSHIKQNLAHKERFYVQYDVFSPERPENRLIKSTLRYLKLRTKNARSRKDLSALLMSFDGIGYSVNYKDDFAQYIKNRNISDYDTVMLWCKVFLLGRSFTAFSGSEEAYALLFPMEQLFESYVAALLKKRIDLTRYSIKTQDSGYHLFDKPSKKFSLRPDIVIEDNTNGTIIVLDTKWKRLDANHRNYGITQADMYQMYAYHKKYKAEQVILLYPLSEKTERISNGIDFAGEDGVKVKVMFVDLLNMEKHLEQIIDILQVVSINSE